MPRQCGIATFTTDLTTALTARVPTISTWVVAMNDSPSGYEYPPVVGFEINQERPREYVLAADFINRNRVDVVCLQHEYGIFGGKCGRHIINLLRELRSPIVTTLHTILKRPSRCELEVMNQLTDLSDRLVVMARRSVEILRDVYNCPEGKIAYIPHGIPDAPLVDSAMYKYKLGMEDRKVILTFGLLSPNKGLEYMIEALPKIVKAHPDVKYMVIGATHPHVKVAHGEEYRASLQLRANELGVADQLVFHNKFVVYGDLIEFLGAADIYVTPYLNEDQIVSGTLAYALGLGKAVVSTPYWHAQECLQNGKGRLVPFKDSASLADQIIDLFDNPDTLNDIRQKAYLASRKMVWSEVAARYCDVFTEAITERTRRRDPTSKLALS